MNKKNYPFLIVFSFLLFACNSGVRINKISGQWKVTDMKVDIPNVPPLLIKNAKTLALSTTYEFKSDLTYSMTILRNELENGRKHIGVMTINANNVSLSTDSLLTEENEIWSTIKLNDFNKPYFETMEIKIEKITPNQLIISEKETNGTIYYTLNRIE